MTNSFAASVGRPLVALLGLLVASASASAADAPTPAEIDRLIGQLGSDSLDDREAATDRLEKIGEPALPALAKAANDGADAEVRLRAAKAAVAEPGYGAPGRYGYTLSRGAERDAPRAARGPPRSAVCEYPSSAA